jgi:hypothetical protein
MVSCDGMREAASMSDKTSGIGGPRARSCARGWHSSLPRVSQVFLPRASHVACVIAAGVLTASCAEREATGPAGPSSLSSQLLPRVEGVWGGQATLVDVARGAGSARDAASAECVVNQYRAVVGETVEQVITITQKDSDVTARLVDTKTGLSCTYTGKLGSGATVLAAQACGGPRLVFRCEPNAGSATDVRYVELAGSSLSLSFDAPVQVATLNGTSAHTFNLYDPNNVIVGSVVSNHRFSPLTRR